MLTRDALHRIYDGPVPDDLARAARCGGLHRLAGIRAKRASRLCDGEAQRAQTRRRSARDRRADRNGEREMRAIRAAGMAHLRCLPLLPAKPGG
jgi:hypothetical protein